VLSCDVIIWDDNTPLFIFPENFTHSSDSLKMRTTQHFGGFFHRANFSAAKGKKGFPRQLKYMYSTLLVFSLFGRMPPLQPLEF
jgi:hypothetical protein